MQGIGIGIGVLGVGVSGGGGGLTFLLRDDFITDRAAGAVNGTAAEPTGGARTVTDGNSKLSIAPGKATFATGGVGDGNPAIWWPAQTRAAGLAAIAKANNGATNSVIGAGWDSAQSGAILDSVVLYGLDLYAFVNGTFVQLGTVANGVEYYCAVVLRSTGALHFIKGGAFTSWTLIYVGAAGNGASVYPGVSGSSANVCTVDFLRALQLAAPFDTDFGISTQRLAGAQSAGATFVHEANCFIEFTATTLPGSSTLALWFRIQDGNNRWIAYVNNAGNFGLGEFVAGVYTERATATGVVSNGHRIIIVADASTIRGYSNNVLRWTYSSASNFQTAINGQMGVVGPSGVASDLIAWPRTLSGQAAALLDQAVS